MPPVSYQPNRNVSQFPGRYNHKLLFDAMNQAGESPDSLAKKANKSKNTIKDALTGDCKKMETLWDIAIALKIQWEHLFKLDLPKSQPRRAVNGAAR